MSKVQKAVGTNETRNYTLAYKVLDEASTAITDRWGKDRLLRLVPDELRERFLEAERQLDAAVEGHDMDRAAQKATALARGVAALDKAARDAGNDPDQVQHFKLTVNGRDFIVPAHTDEWPPLKRLYPAGCIIAAEELLRLQIATEAGKIVFATKDAFPGAMAVYGGPMRSGTLSRVIDDEIPF